MEFIDSDGLRRYVFEFHRHGADSVEVTVFALDDIWGWVLEAQAGRIDWLDDGVYSVSPEAKDHIERMMKLGAFW